MKTPVKLIVFVNNSASTANKPDETTNVLRLNLPPKSDKIDDDNQEAFGPDSQRKSALIEIQGLTDELQAQFKGGQRVTLTIE